MALQGLQLRRSGPETWRGPPGPDRPAGEGRDYAAHPPHRRGRSHRLRQRGQSDSGDPDGQQRRRQAPFAVVRCHPHLAGEAPPPDPAGHAAAPAGARRPPRGGQLAGQLALGDKVPIGFTWLGLYGVIRVLRNHRLYRHGVMVTATRAPMTRERGVSARMRPGRTAASCTARPAPGSRGPLEEPADRLGAGIAVHAPGQHLCGRRPGLLLRRH